MVQKPSLKGKRIAITRAATQATETSNLIEELGGKAYLFPTLKFKLPEDLTPVKKFIEDIKAGKADYTIFMSSNAVEFLFNEAKLLGLAEELRDSLRKTLLVAVGPKTAEKLEAYGLRVDILPEKYSSEALAKTMEKRGISGKRIFIPRVKNAGPALRDKLNALGGIVVEIPVYEQMPPSSDESAGRFAEALALGLIDAIIFGSSQSARNFMKLLEKHLTENKLKEVIKKVTIVAIGPETARTLNEMGLKADVIPENYTFKEALEALANYWSQKGEHC